MGCRYTYKGQTYEAHEFDDVLRGMPIAEAAKYMPGVSPLPAAPFVDDTSSWLRLALKRVIHMAAAGGYDSVAFVNGEQSAERYDLSKQVDKLVWDEGGGSKNTGFLKVFKDGSVIARHEATAEKLPDLVGKEVSRKLVEQQPDTGLGERTLSGLDLKVGGEGMKAFYDQIVPQAASALVKKMGGEGMTTVSLPGADATPIESYRIGDDGDGAFGVFWRATGERISAGHATKAEARAEMIKISDSEPTTQPAFAITPAMREKAAGGMPLFSREREASIDATYKEIARDQEMIDALEVYMTSGNAPEGELNDRLVAYMRRLPPVPADSHLTFYRNQPSWGKPWERGWSSWTINEDQTRYFGGRDFEVLKRKGAQGLDLGRLGEYRSQVTGEYHQYGSQGEWLLLNESVFPDGAVRFSRERTQTPEFKSWLGSSKVVDEDGNPLVLYHITTGDFSKFIPGGKDATLSGPAIWMTDNKELQPAMHNVAARKGFREGANVMPLYARIERPLVIDTKDMLDWARDVFAGGSREFPQLMAPKWVAELTKDGEYDGIIFDGPALGWKDAVKEYIVFAGNQVKSAIGNDGSFDDNDPNILSSAARNWASPGASKFDDAVQKLQDKHVDLLRVQQAVAEAGGAIRNDIDAYLKEELFHGRAAKRTEDFAKKELEPLTKAMAERGVTVEELDEYLHARHAPEANRLVAERNPDSPLLQDGGSGLDTELAKQYMADLAPDKRAHLQAVAADVDKILAKTRKLVVDYELESKDTVAGWAGMFEHYVPLMREDDGDAPSGIGTGQGFSIKGREVKSRTGSTKKVVDILANIAMQRERTIVRGEKNRVAQAAVNLARENPNKDFWAVDLVPTTPTFDAKKGVVVHRPDPMFKMRPNAVVAKFREEDGSVKEHAIVFSEKNARAMRAASAMKNLEAARMEGLLGGAAAVTRYFSAIVTQYNPVFGVMNFARDFGAVMVNLKSTPLDGMQGQVAKDAMSAIRQLYSNLRSGKEGSELQKLWDEFRDVGGQTGYRQLFADSGDRADALREAINPDAWTESKLGKVFTANGVLKVPMARAMRASKGVFKWLTDYNETLENATRLAVYKAGKKKFLEQGLPEQEAREQAASVAKNITTNFNRKGELGQQIGALYAFFNASMQGTARMSQLLFEMEPGKPKTIRLSRVGKRIVSGGVLLGVAQALALAAAGFSDDDPPDFVRERSLVIPTGGKSYISIPLPLGLHVLPNIGRIATEWAMSGFEKTPQRAIGFIGLLADSFVPTGSSGLSMQTLAPTAVDPLVALTENKDWQGRPIAKESMNPAAPGHALVKDTATMWSRQMAELINYATGGNQYLRGAVSPTPDQIDYLLGAFGGGVAKEISKTQQTASALITGESLPTYKIPLVGRVVGNAASQQSEGTAFYSTSRKLNELETEIKGLQKDGKFTEANALRATRPEAYLVTQVNRAERDIAKLRKEKGELIAAGGEREKVRALEERITARMAAFNRAAEALKERAPT